MASTEHGCYTNQYGKPMRNCKWGRWEIKAKSFSYRHPHLLLFSDSFVDIRHAATGQFRHGRWSKRSIFDCWTRPGSAVGKVVYSYDREGRIMTGTGEAGLWWRFRNCSFANAEDDSSHWRSTSHYPETRPQCVNSTASDRRFVDL